MPSLTSWTRLEPDDRRDATSASLAARLLDPVWLLTRQWQVGEFQAEDAGTPVVARVRAQAVMLTRCHLGELPANTVLQAPAYDPLAAPLEALAERRQVRATGPADARALRLTIEAGRHLLRMLAAQPLAGDYSADFVRQFVLAMPAAGSLLDDTTARRWRLAAGRVMDARLLMDACRRHGTQAVVADPALGIAAADRAEVRDAVDQWLDWYARVVDEPGPDGDAWVESRLEHQLSVAARLSPDPFDEVTLTATQIDGGRLDWSSFDLDAEVRTGTDGDSAVTSLTRTVVPAPVSIPGTPSHRYWELESAQLDYSQIASQPTDLAHALLTEYASSYGNDWYLVPLTLPVGSLTRISSLVVTDTFGVRTLLRPVGDRQLPASSWAMWQLAYIHRPGSDSPSGCVRNLFYLPPTAGQLMEGPVVEDVLLLRDETANVAWGVERLLETPWETGAPALEPDELEADEGVVASTTSPPDTGRDGPSRYLLSTTVPRDWVPLLPVQSTQPDGTVTDRLRVGAVLQPDATVHLQPARSRLLASGTDIDLYAEEVPREGKHVTRRRRLTRWIDGSVHLWEANQVQIGRGEGSSGLVFDSLQPPVQP